MKRTSRSKCPVVSKDPVVACKAISLDDLNLKHGEWTYDDNVELLGVLREHYDANTDKVPWESVVGIGPTKIRRDKYACKDRLRKIKDHNPTMSMTELLDPDNIGIIKFRNAEWGTLSGQQSIITPEEMTAMAIFIKEQRNLEPPKLTNRKQIIEYYTQQNDGVQKFGHSVAINLIKMVRGKEVTPLLKKVGTTTRKLFISDKSKDADYNLLKGKNPFFMTAEKLEEMMKNTPVHFTFR
jgi:hypothetical protein